MKKNSVEPVKDKKSSILKELNKNNKFVSFQENREHLIINSEEGCISKMQGGTYFIKLKENGNHFKRKYFIDKDKKIIRWYPTNKKNNNSAIAIQDIKELKNGICSPSFVNYARKCNVDEENCMSIIYGDNFNRLDLFNDDPIYIDIWRIGLQLILNKDTKRANMDNITVMRDKWLKTVFDTANIDESGMINLRQLSELVSDVGEFFSISKIVRKIKEMVKNEKPSETDVSEKIEERKIDLNAFIGLCKELCVRPEVYSLLVKYSSNADYISTDDLMIFFETEQGQSNMTKNDCLNIIKEFETTQTGITNGYFTIDGFTRFLSSYKCHIFNNESSVVYQNMDQPLSHYFINSSHNTYLTQDQLKGDSHIDAYKKALIAGCRCVELDCWDGTKNEPIIYHGHTLTSKIEFLAVIETINEYAFLKSDYPLVLSIENHCSPPFQSRMVYHMKTILSDSLYTEKINDKDECLPAPNYLKRKILIKCKKLKNGENQLASDDEEEESNKSKKIKRIAIIQELSDLVNYFASTGFKKFENSHLFQQWYECCSFSEDKALDLINTESEEFIEHNKTFISRIYPAGRRIDSSNFKDDSLVKFWANGIQMAALNFQTNCIAMDLNVGRFNDNGGCGYVLKPQILRDSLQYYAGNSNLPGTEPSYYRIKVISCQNLITALSSNKPKNIDAIVEITIYSLEQDNICVRTKASIDGGYNPIFDESFEFQIHYPEFALIRFAVYDVNNMTNKFLCQYTINANCINQGYRFVPLFDKTRKIIKGCRLFLQIKNSKTLMNLRIKKYAKTIRKKKSRLIEYTSLKAIKFHRQIDETFKISLHPLRDSCDIRDQLEYDLIYFKSVCYLPPSCNLKQCIRYIKKNYQFIKIKIHSNYPYIDTENDASNDELDKIILAFEMLVKSCKNVIQNYEHIHGQLMHSKMAALEWNNEMKISDKKIYKKYSWNIHIIQGHCELITRAYRSSQEYLLQLVEASE